MPKYNSTFELTPDDMELIEHALRRTRQDLSSRMAETAVQHDKVADRGDGDLRQIQDLLGRLHNQKVFYRPRRGAYIGG